jgi:hypothetical protein
MLPVTIKSRRGLKANLPAEAAEGELLVATDTGELFLGCGAGEPLLALGGTGRTMLIEQAWAIGGAVDGGELPPVTIALLPGQTKRITRAIFQFGVDSPADALALLSVRVNGLDALGLSDLFITREPGQVDVDVPLSDGAVVSLVLANVSGSPVGFSCTLVIEYTP